MTEPGHLGPDIGEPSWARRLHFGVIAFLLIELAIGVIFRSADHLADKGMVMRAVFYPIATIVVPVGWHVRGRPAPFPHLAAALLVLPFGLDIGGNLVKLFEVDRFDDVLHFVNWFLLIGGVTTLLLRTRERLLVLFVIGVGASATAIILWEFVEYLVQEFGTTGLQLTYEDTITDLMESWIGGAVGAAVVTGTRWRGLIRRPGQVTPVGSGTAPSER